jgi:hypothetical protein
MFVVAPSPLEGEGNSEVQREGLGEGLSLTEDEVTPHPTELVEMPE